MTSHSCCIWGTQLTEIISTLKKYGPADYGWVSSQELSTEGSSDAWYPCHSSAGHQKFPRQFQIEIWFLFLSWSIVQCSCILFVQLPQCREGSVKSSRWKTPDKTYIILILAILPEFTCPFFFFLAWILGDSFILVKQCLLFSPGLLRKNLITNSSRSVKLVVASWIFDVTLAWGTLPSVVRNFLNVLLPLHAAEDLFFIGWVRELRVLWPTQLTV